MLVAVEWWSVRVISRPEFSVPGIREDPLADENACQFHAGVL
jgi:hypothetical protein